MARAGAVDFSTRSAAEQQALADYKKANLSDAGKIKNGGTGGWGQNLYALERGGLTGDDYEQSGQPTGPVPTGPRPPAAPAPAAAPSGAPVAAPSMAALSTVAGAAAPTAMPGEGFGAEMPTPLATGQGRRTLPASSYALAQIAGQRGGVY